MNSNYYALFLSLILILFGGIALLVNFRYFEIGMELLRYWPVLLIHLGCESILKFIFDKDGRNNDT